MHSAVRAWSLENREDRRGRAHTRSQSEYTHIYELACMIHKKPHTDAGNCRAAPQLVLSLCHHCSRQTWGWEIRIMLRRGWGGRGDPGLPLPSRLLIAVLLMPPVATWEERCLAAACYLWWCPARQHGECLPGEAPHVTLELYLMFMSRRWGGGEGRRRGGRGCIRCNYSRHSSCMMIFLCGTVFALKL